ncbi:MAG: zinc ABC transporter substrate-binding protein, partial [Caldiserica bacterium]|nr:zinc ABC transporter substrate-binding protein [Caldisericota bacterium]
GAGTLDVVATSAVLGDLATRIGGDAVAVTVIIPPGFCPAHYDLKPSDLLAVSRADLVLYHGIEPWIEELLARVNPDAMVLPLKGPWNTPDPLLAKAKAIADALARLVPDEAEGFTSRYESFASDIRSWAERTLARSAELGLSGIAAIVMQWQAGFAKWIGLRVVATYPPEERLSLRDLAELTGVGKEAGVTVVIDNLQSGVTFGAKLAHALGAIHVVLTNFPGALPGTADLPSMLARNAEAVFAAVEALRPVP